MYVRFHHTSSPSLKALITPCALKSRISPSSVSLWLQPQILVLGMTNISSTSFFRLHVRMNLIWTNGQLSIQSLASLVPERLRTPRRSSPTLPLSVLLQVLRLKFKWPILWRIHCRKEAKGGWEEEGLPWGPGGADQPGAGGIRQRQDGQERQLLPVRQVHPCVVQQHGSYGWR